MPNFPWIRALMRGTRWQFVFFFTIFVLLKARMALVVLLNNIIWRNCYTSWRSCSWLWEVHLLYKFNWKGGNCKCSGKIIEAVRRLASCSGCFDQICTVHAHWFLASDQNSDIAIRFNDSYLKKTNNNYLTIRRHFHAMTFAFDPSILNISSTKIVTCKNLCTNFERNETFLGCYWLFNTILTFDFKGRRLPSDGS